MVKSLISNILLLIIVGISLALPSPGTFSQVQGWGNNPTNSEFWIYVPRGKPMAVVAAVHHCSGSAKIYWQGTKGQYQPLADKYNFVLVYPSSPHQGGCWDVSSKSSLSHSGNGDSNSIANMVRWATKQYDVTREKTFLFGTSSGAMMSNVLAATYPDLFSAGSVHSGVPAGCFFSSNNGINAWNSTCAGGKSVKKENEWAQIVKNMYPGYSGPRPKMQIFHGGNDQVLAAPNYNETIKQWCGVFGYDYNKPIARTSGPGAGYTTTSYGPNLRGIYAPGAGHNLPAHSNQDMDWFGFR